MVVNLKKLSEREPIADVIDRLRKKLAAIDDVQTILQPFQDLQLGVPSAAAA